MPPIKFPTPMVGLAVTPKSRGDEAKLSGALHKIVEEDATFRLDRDPQTKELVMTGMSELHLQILRERLKRRDKVEVEPKEPKIPYRETIQPKAEGSYRHKKQIGRPRPVRRSAHPHVPAAERHQRRRNSAPRTASRHMREFHYDEKHNFLWVDSIVGGTIPEQLSAGRGKGLQGTAGARRDRRLPGAERRRRGPLRQASRRRQLGSGLQDGRLDGLPQRVPGGQAGAAWSRS